MSSAHTAHDGKAVMDRAPALEYASAGALRLLGAADLGELHQMVLGAEAAAVAWRANVAAVGLQDSRLDVIRKVSPENLFAQAGG